MLTDLPNLLTLTRIATIPFLVVSIALQNNAASAVGCVIYIIACVTDYFDGMLARRWKQNSEIGRMMDPIADKLLVGALLMALAGYGRLVDGSVFAAIIILIREILISGLREYMASQDQTLPSSRLAKWKTGIQMIAIGFLMAGSANGAWQVTSFGSALQLGALLLWLSVIPTVLSGWRYLTTGVTYMLGVTNRERLSR